MNRLTRAASVAAVIVFLVAAAIATFAQTQPATTRRISPEARAQAPAPTSSVATLLPVTGKFEAAKPVPVFPRRPAAQRGKSSSRTLKSLNGSTILLSGASNACFPTTGGGTVVTDDTVLQPGCGLTWTASNLTNGYVSGSPSTPNYTDYMQAPNSTVATVVGTAGYTGTTGTGHAITGMIAGTYVFGTYDNVNNVWIAILWVQVGNLAALDTYSDNQYTSPTESIAIGSPVYIQATGLTPQHNYVVSIVNASETGACVYIAPNTSGTTSLSSGVKSLCDVSTANTSGTYAPSNVISFTWTPTAGVVSGFQGTAPTLAPGTYAISLYDQTAAQAVAQRQIAVTSSVNTGVIPTIQFFSGPGSSGTLTPSANTPARIAWNGANSPHADSNLTYMSVGIGAINLPTATPAGVPKFTFTLTDPSGKVQYSSTQGNGSTTLTPTSDQTALPTTTLDFAGEFPTSTWTAGVYQVGQKSGAVTTTPAPLAVRGLKILSYAGEADWVTTSGGTESTLILPTTPTGTGYAAQLKFANTGDQAVGLNNADPIKAFVMSFSNNAAFYRVRFYDGNSSDPTPCNGGVTPGNSPTCTQSFIRDRTSGAITGNLVDSAGHPWTAAITCTDSSISASTPCTTTSQFFLTLTPNNASQPLQPGQYIITPDLFLEANQSVGVNNCPSLCNQTVAVAPLDGITPTFLSGGSKVINSVGVQFGASGAAKLYGFMYFAGTYTSGTTFTQNTLPSGYAPRPGATSPATASPVPQFTSGPQAALAAGQPFAATGQLGFVLQVSDQNTPTNDYVQSLAAQLPSGFDSTSAKVFTVNGTTLTAQTMIAGGTGNCPTGNVCWTGPGNTNLLAATGSSNNSASVPAFQNYFIAINAPTKSFSYTDVAVTVIQGAQGAQPVRNASQAINTFVGTPASVDAITIGAYSLNATEMLGSLNPTTVGAGVTTNLTFSLQNTTTSLDPFPDYLDAYVVELPNNGGSSLIAASNGVPTSCSTITVNTASWTCIQVVTGATFNTYWFAPTGCSELYNSTLPPTGSGVKGGNLEVTASAACRLSLQSNALPPGGQNSVTFPITTSGATPAPSATPLPVTMYAHGANTNAWSNPVTSTFQVSPTAQSAAGFTNAGPYTTGVPAAVGSGQQPVITTDTNATSGNSYIYTISNVGSIPIKGAVVTIPHLDSGGNTNGKYWTVTSATLTGGNASCVLSAPVSATSSSDGNFTIGGAGCLLATNATFSIRFNALSPGAVNSTYLWPTKVTDTSNNTVKSQENWFDDTTINIALSASLQITVQTSPSCTYGTGEGPVAPNVGTNTINFGYLFTGTTIACTSAVQTSVYTNASSPVGWTLYAQITGNVSVTGTAPSGLTSELAIRPTVSSGGVNPAQSFLTYGANTYNVASGSGTAGFALLHSDGSGPAAAQTAPFVITTDLQLSAGTESTAAQNTADVVFTWISS